MAATGAFDRPCGLLEDSFMSFFCSSDAPFLWRQQQSSRQIQVRLRTPTILIAKTSMA